MKITKVEIFPARDPERLKASAAVVFDDCFKVRDIFIFPRKDNSDELYVAMPVKKIKDDKRISLAHPINAEFRAEMEKAMQSHPNTNLFALNAVNAILNRLARQGIANAVDVALMPESTM